MQNKQKILYIITIPDWGGAQRYVFDLANNLKDTHEAVVASGKSEGTSKINLLEKCREAEITTYQFKNLVRPISPIKDIFAVWEMKNYLEKEKPDTIHLNSSKAGIIASFATVLSSHKPEVVYTVHGWVFTEPMNALKKGLYIFLEKIASYWRDKIIVLGEKEKQIALNYKICSPEKLQIAHHTIANIDFFTKQDAREKLNLPQDKKIIGTVANFYPAKGLNYLIEAAAKINNPDVIFAIIGEGALRKNFKFQISNFKLENKFILLGEKNNAAQYLKAFDVFVLPSVKEGAPYVILEAVAAELPIVATDVGNVSEMLKDYQNKIIIPSSNVEALVEAISTPLPAGQRGCLVSIN